MIYIVHISTTNIDMNLPFKSLVLIIDLLNFMIMHDIMLLTTGHWLQHNFSYLGCKTNAELRSIVSLIWVRPFNKSSV